jgi:hypothetical protein
MKPDVQLMIAVQRVQSGAEIHKLNNLLHQYMCACHAENRPLADRAKHKLMAVVLQKQWQRKLAANAELLPRT